MIESLLATFGRSLVWTLGKSAGRQLWRRASFWVWIVVGLVAAWLAMRAYGPQFWPQVQQLWFNSLHSSAIRLALP